MFGTTAHQSRKRKYPGGPLSRLHHALLGVKHPRTSRWQSVHESTPAAALTPFSAKNIRKRRGSGVSVGMEEERARSGKGNLSQISQKVWPWGGPESGGQTSGNRCVRRCSTEMRKAAAKRWAHQCLLPTESTGSPPTFLPPAPANWKQKSAQGGNKLPDMDVTWEGGSARRSKKL